MMFTCHVECALCLVHIGAIPKEQFVSNFLRLTSFVQLFNFAILNSKV